MIATYIADKIAEKLDLISLPPITYTIAIPVRPGNVYIPRNVFKAYVKAVIEHFIDYGLRKFILMLAHGGPDMKQSVEDICEELWSSRRASILVVHVSTALQKMNLIDASVYRHASTWETSIVMAIDRDLVENLNMYKDVQDLKHYGVVGDPRKTNIELGKNLIESLTTYIENLIRKFTFNECYVDRR